MEAMDRLQDAINSMTSDLDRATIRRHALLSNLVLEAASDISLSSLETLRSDTAARGFRLIDRHHHADSRYQARDGPPRRRHCF